MRCTCKHHPRKDIQAVVPGLQVDIPDSLDYNRIKDTSVPAHYNGQKETSEIGSRIYEPFDVIEYDRSYTRIRKEIRDKKSENADI